MRQGKRLFERLTRYDWIFLIGFVLVALFCLWKAPIEIQGQDEAFYLTIPKRLLDHDSFIVDEWHGSQLAAIFSYPLIWLHRLLFGFDAIVLHFRYLYIFFHLNISSRFIFRNFFSVLSLKCHFDQSIYQRFNIISFCIPKHWIHTDRRKAW